MEQFSSSGFGLTAGNPSIGAPLAIEAALLPLVAACSFGPDDFDWWSHAAPVAEDCRYHNAGTCPDCGTGMVRLGNCYSCPGCGWGSCGG